VRLESFEDFTEALKLETSSIPLGEKWFAEDFKFSSEKCELIGIGRCGESM
jgi:hypothetical protein